MDFGAIFRATSAAPRQSTILYSTPIIPSQQLNLCINPNSPLLSSTASFPAGSSGRRIGIGLSRKLRFQKRIEAKVGKATKTASIADSEKKWTHYGLITESLPNGMFRVGLLNFIDNKFVRVNEDEVLGYVSGKIRTNHIRIVPGDTVRIEVSPYDSNKGRIVYRFSRRDMEKLTGSEDNG